MQVDGAAGQGAASGTAYRFQCDVRALDFWKLTMRQTYRSLAGICNIVFTAAMIALAVRFWNTAGDLFQVLILFACLLFPVIQPIAVYLRAKGQAAAMPQGVVLEFDEKGLHVTVGGQHEDLPWRQVRVRRQSDMLVVFSDARHGYLLTNRVLGKEKEPFFAYAKEHTC